MEKRYLQILNNEKGNSLPEALIGFLIAVLTSMILVSVVMASGNIMAAGQDALDIVYKEQRALDIFLHHDYDSLGNPMDPGPNTFRYQVNAVIESGDVVSAEFGSGVGDTTTITLHDLGDPDDPNNGSPTSPRYTDKQPLVTYCRAERSGVYCFTTPPGAVGP